MARQAVRVSGPSGKKAQLPNTGRWLSLGLVNLIVWVAVVLSLYPIFVMVLNSFKPSNEINFNPVGWPQTFTFENYSGIITRGGSLYLNAILVALVTTVLSVLLAALAAFAFAKYQFKGRNLIFIMLMATMLVPGEVSIAPLYLMFANIDWINTYQVQIVPSIISVFGMFMIRQYMLSIPDSLLDAARIDGANDLQVFWRVVVPVCVPVLSSLAILQFLGMWNSYLWPLIVANDPKVEPIMVFLPSLTDQSLGFLPSWGLIMAGCVLASVPVMLLFLFFQRSFISGVVVGAVRE